MRGRVESIWNDRGEMRNRSQELWRPRMRLFEDSYLRIVHLDLNCIIAYIYQIMVYVTYNGHEWM